MSDLKRLFEPIRVGELDLPNRIVMAPLTRSRSDEEGRVPTYAADYYSQRADAGLVITEATNISPGAVGYALTPGIWSDDQVEAWKPVVEAVHEREGRFVLQLWHTGRISHPDLHGGELPGAPSAVKPEGKAFTADGMKDMVTPRAFETAEIPAILEDYRRAAVNAKEAGFDAVEIHSANNYLLEQFVRDSTNQREDEYGGSLENRLRFPLEVAAAVVEIWGAGRVGIRISPGTTMPGETPIDSEPTTTYGRYLEHLGTLGLAYTHVMEGLIRESREWPDEVDGAELRRRAPGAYMANNELDPERRRRTDRERARPTSSPSAAPTSPTRTWSPGSPPAPRSPRRRKSTGTAATRPATRTGRGPRSRPPRADWPRASEAAAAH